MRVAAALATALALGVLLPTGAGATQPRVSQTQIESEVMCPVCGTLLELAESPQAQREKAFIARQIAAGKTEAQIEDALVADYGHAVLALPQGSGFSLSAYLVPIVAFLVAAAALGVGIWRWRRGGGGSGGLPPPSGLSSADSERLDADLAHYDL